MQSDHKQIYKLTSERTGKSEQLYKDLGNFVFTETNRLLRKPKSLVLKLKGIGSWYLRRKRMQIVIDTCAHRIIEKARDTFVSDKMYEEYLEKKEQYLNFVDRLKDYEEYTEIKKEVKKKRIEAEILPKPNKGKDDSSESS